MVMPSIWISLVIIAWRSLVPSRPRRFRMWRHLSSLSGKFAEDAWQIMTNPKWRYRATTLAKFLQKASETGWVSLVNVCYEIRKVVGEVLFKESMVDEINVDFYVRQIVPSQELKKYVLLNSTGYLARHQASSDNSDNANRPGYEVELDSLIKIGRYAKIFEKMMSRLEYEISVKKHVNAKELFLYLKCFLAKKTMIIILSWLAR